MDLEQMLTRATAELESAEVELQAAQQRVEELRTIQQGIQLAIQRYGHTVAQPAPTVADAAVVSNPGDDGARATNDPSMSSRVPETVVHARSDWRHSDLCLEALREFGRPASSTEIRERLSQRGHQFTAEQTRGTMAYLLRKQRVVRTAPGVWTLGGRATTNLNDTNGRYTPDRNY